MKPIPRETSAVTIDDPAQTVGLALRHASRQLRAAGVDTPELDARRLAEAATGLTPETMLRDPAQMLSGEARARLSEFVTRRAAREPVSRIIGTREFYGRPFRVTPATLDPRPESETLIDAALSLVSHTEALRILDLCTGTGCLLLTLLAELPMATGVGSDISRDALDVARQNARLLGMDTRAEWIEADLMQGLEGPFNLIVANPPYIPSGEIAGLAPEVRLHDPHLALDGGEDGLTLYRSIIENARRVAPGGWVVLELGAFQAGPVESLIVAQEAGSASSTVRRYLDLAGHTRCVAWRARS